MSEIDQLRNEVAYLRKLVERLSGRPAFIRVRGDKSIMKKNGLHLAQVNGNVYSFAFDTPRIDDNYGVVTEVHHPTFWRTWGRVTNMTVTGFDVHFLNEQNVKITDTTLEVTVLVCTTCD